MDFRAKPDVNWIWVV